MKKEFLISALAVFLLLPSRASALCEPPGVSAAAEVAEVALENATTLAVEAALEVFYAGQMALSETLTVEAEDQMEETILDNLDGNATEWNEAWRDMTEQLNAGDIDQSRQAASLHDSNNLSAAAVKVQEKKIEGHKQYQPTDQACQFDTLARYLARGRQLSAAATAGYTADFSKIGSNDKNEIGATGKAGVNRTRFEKYQNKFCNGVTNNGHAGCAPGNPAADRHVLPSRTIFAKETIDTSDPDTQAALDELIFNITGYDVPDTIPGGSLKSATGKEQRQENREYLAQMDAVNALVASVVSDRIPGALSPEVKALRVKAGVTDASEKPSLREIRQATIEQLWDPNYYRDLNENAVTAAQKELYLKAYGLMALRDIIDKQEKISVVYAIEAANLLNKTDRSRHSVSSSAPTGP